MWIIQTFSGKNDSLKEVLNLSAVYTSYRNCNGHIEEESHLTVTLQCLPRHFFLSKAHSETDKPNSII